MLQYTKTTSPRKCVWELYRDVDPTFYPATREYLGVVKASSDIPSDWDSGTVDAPFVLTDNIYRDSYNTTAESFWCYHDAYGEDNLTWQEGIIIMPYMELALGIIPESKVTTLQILDGRITLDGQTYTFTGNMTITLGELIG